MSRRCISGPPRTIRGSWSSSMKGETCGGALSLLCIARRYNGEGQLLIPWIASFE